MALVVNEIFHSIQGESTHAGRPCVFIRLTGCNLRCAYCDTVYAYDEGEPWEIEQIAERAESFGCSLIEITGGEPLVQADTPALVERLLGGGHQVLMETNGSLDISRVDSRCTRIMDIKCPSSGHTECNDLDNLKRLTANDELKFVIGDRDDYRFARRMVQSPAVAGAATDHILFSPIFNRLSPSDLAQWILADRLDVRLQLQLHKHIWDPNRRGV